MRCFKIIAILKNYNEAVKNLRMTADILGFNICGEYIMVCIIGKRIEDVTKCDIISDDLELFRDYNEVLTLYPGV